MSRENDPTTGSSSETKSNKTTYQSFSEAFDAAREDAVSEAREAAPKLKGAFEGAMRRRSGKIEAANGGTLYIDEVADLPTDLQLMLLGRRSDRVINLFDEHKDAGHFTVDEAIEELERKLRK